MKRTYIVIDHKRKMYAERGVESRAQLVALHELVNSSGKFAGDVIEKDNTLHNHQKYDLQEYRKVRDVWQLL